LRRPGRLVPDGPARYVVVHVFENEFEERRMARRRMPFRTIDVGDGSDGRWAAHTGPRWQTMTGWLTEEARTPAGAARGRALFERHMPELVPVLDRLAGQVEGPYADALLTMTGLRPFFAGCSQVGGPNSLLRNYDFDPDDCEGTVVASHFLRRVIGTQDTGWGLLDGMNDAGLAVSLTFGGRFEHGPGFGVILVLRYLLETCAGVDEAVDRLRSIPVSLPQNITLVDADRAATVYVGPDIPLTAAPDACATNHQHLPVPDGQERFTRTQQRLAAVRGVGVDVAAMLRPPLYQSGYEDGMGTVYTAHYRPVDGCVTYHWPDESWEVTFDGFAPAERTVTIGQQD
jgi:predicted choloylglycine hydrolase